MSGYLQIPISSSHEESHTQTSTAQFSTIMAGNKEVTITRVDGKIEITHEVLGAINVSQMRNENKDNLVALGGVENLVTSLGVDTSTGLTGIKLLTLNIYTLNCE